MNYIDLFVIVILVYAVFRGITRGLIHQVASLAALIIGGYLALKFSGVVSRWLSRYLTFSFEYIYILALAATFTLVFIGLKLLGEFLDKVVKTAQLSLINKLLGAFFNVCKVMLITGVILLFAQRVNDRIFLLPKNSWDNSLFFRPVTRFTLMIFPDLRHDRDTNRDQNEEFAQIGSKVG
jgi:membrane protein required for colicin V production